MWRVPMKHVHVHVHVLNYSLISCSKVLSDHIMAEYLLHIFSILGVLA